MSDQTVLQLISARFAEAISKVAGFESDPIVRAATDARHGDYQSNAAMSLAGRLSKERGEKVNPRGLAEQIAAAVNLDGIAEKPEIAGPGFLNVKLLPGFIAERCNAAADSDRLAVPAASEPQTVVVEYSSPNIAKQLHVGHFRATILGDAVARLEQFLQHNVIRQNHVGDWGTQFGMLIARLREVGGVKDAPIGSLEAFYKQAKHRFDEDDDFKTVARETVVALQRGDEEVVAAWQRFIDETRAHYEPLYGRLGVLLQREDERGESFYNDQLGGVVDDLLKAGVAEESEGAVVSFAGGHKAPLMIRKSDGGYGYGTTDLAACKFRSGTLNADLSVYLVDARQSQHFQQVFATYAEAVDKAGWPGGCAFKHAAFGAVLGEDGKPFKTREGKTVQLANLLDEAEQKARKVVDENSSHLPEDEKAELARQVGIGAVKYADLSKDRTSDYVFSFDEMLRLDGNSGPYVQYAHARTQSVLRKATDAGILGEFSVKQFGHDGEVALARQLLGFGEAVLSAAEDLRPHVLCNYLYETAKQFSSFYDNCSILKSEGDQQQTRLALTKLTGRTIATGLDLLGIAAPSRM